MPKDYAIVAGLGINGLGVLRALGHASVPVVGLYTDAGDPTAATRFGKKIRVNTLSGRAFIEALLTLRRRFASDPVLILTQEASVSTVSLARDEIASLYRLVMPDHSLVEELSNKLSFQTIAERHGFPIPHAARLNAHTGSEAISALRFPCIVKPAKKHSDYGKHFAKAYKVANAGEVQALWSAMRGIVEEIIVQEWIEGDDVDVYFCLQYRGRAGQRSLSFVGRKICQWPPLTGGTASCVPAPDVSKELTALTDAFFERVGFFGMGSMEFTRDRRDGRFYFVEPTIGRSDYQEEIAYLNGVNIPLAAYLDALGRSGKVEPEQKPQRAWRDAIGHARARMAGAPDLLSTLSPNIKVCDAMFRIDDPMPYVASKLYAIRGSWRRGGQPQQP
jgi:D-aspartate ligase